jgi:hypothetical protein
LLEKHQKKSNTLKKMNVPEESSKRTKLFEVQDGNSQLKESMSTGKVTTIMTQLDPMTRQPVDIISVTKMSQDNTKDRFVFFSDSKAEPLPGKGTSETLVEQGDTYDELASYENWRQVLSNFYCESTLETKTNVHTIMLQELGFKFRFISVEHAFHFLKLRIAAITSELFPTGDNKYKLELDGRTFLLPRHTYAVLASSVFVAHVDGWKYVYQFVLIQCKRVFQNEGDALCFMKWFDKEYCGLDTTGARVKKAGGRSGVYTMNKNEVETWKRRSHTEMKELWRKKFTHWPLARRVLLATKDAELWHHLPRKSVKERWLGLEEIRRTLSSS